MLPALVQNTVMGSLAKFEVIMDFNYLIDPRRRKRTCKVGGNECYWTPAAPGRSTNGDNVHVSMMCKKCGLREDIFMTRKEYKTQERIIEREVQLV